MSFGEQVYQQIAHKLGVDQNAVRWRKYARAIRDNMRVDLSKADMVTALEEAAERNLVFKGMAFCQAAEFQALMVLRDLLFALESHGEIGPHFDPQTGRPSNGLGRAIVVASKLLEASNVPGKRKAWDFLDLTKNFGDLQGPPLPKGFENS
jgi:hypothetical protein